MSSERRAETRRAVIREVTGNDILAITDPAALFRLLAVAARPDECRELVAKAEQLEERGVH